MACARSEVITPRLVACRTDPPVCCLVHADEGCMHGSCSNCNGRLRLLAAAAHA